MHSRPFHLLESDYIPPSPTVSLDGVWHVSRIRASDRAAKEFWGSIVTNRQGDVHQELQDKKT